MKPSEEQDVLAASLEILRAEERIEKLDQDRVDAKTQLRWAQINHRAAVQAYRRARRKTP